jgi:hypothetical protein
MAQLDNTIIIEIDERKVIDIIFGYGIQFCALCTEHPSPDGYKLLCGLGINAL